MIQDITATDAMIQGMIETIMEWAKNAMPEGQKITPGDYKAHFPDIMRWEKEDRKKLKEGIENWLTDMDIQGMRDAIHQWAHSECIQFEEITPNAYKAQFPEIKDWEEASQKRLKQAMIQWLEDEDATHAKNRKWNNKRRARTIAKKNSVGLTPKQATVKKAAAKESKCKTDKAGEKRQHEADAIDIKDSGVSKKPKVERTPKQEEALMKRRDRDCARRLAQKVEKDLEKELDIAHAKEIAVVEEELKPFKGILNRFMHEVFEKLISIKKSSEEDPNDIWPFEVKNLADDMKEIAIQNLSEKNISLYNERPLDELYDLLVTDTFEKIDMCEQVDTDFMNNNFPISDPWVYKQQVASGTSAGCDVSANPSAHGDNVSDSSCDSDEDERLSDSEDKSPPRTPVTPGGPYSRSVSPA
jgi:hypothetical protein